MEKAALIKKNLFTSKLDRT